MAGSTLPVASPGGPKSRDPRIDSLKGFAILLVVLGHAIRQPFAGHVAAASLPWPWAYSLLAAVHMPLFMFVSGWVITREPTLRWLGRRFVQIMVPFLSWALIHFALFARHRGVGYLRHMIVEPRMFWFLPALFISCALLALGRRSEAGLVVAAVAAALVPFAVPAVFGLVKVKTMFVFFVAGYVLRKRDWRPGPLGLLAFPVLLSLLWLPNGVEPLLSVPDWAMAAGGAGTIALSVLRMVMPLAAISGLFYLTGFAQPLQGLGGMTLGVYAGHAYFLRFFPAGSSTVMIVSSFVCALAGGIALTFLLRRSEPSALLFLGRLPARRRPRPAEGRVPGVEAVPSSE